MRRASLVAVMAVGAAAVALAGCASSSKRLTAPEPVTTVKLIQVTSYPELPDIPLPLEPQLLPWEYEVPRDLSKLEPKNTPDCEKVGDKDRDTAYWARCGQNPVIRDTNVLFGLDQRNWNIMLSNFSKLREYIVQLKSRIDVANASRQEWRAKAEEERRRADAAAAPRPAASAP